MNAISNFFNLPHFYPEKENSLFSDQPAVFKFILTHLDYLSLHRTVLVSRYWKEITIDSTKQNQSFLIRQLAGVLRKSVEPPHAGDLHTIENNSVILACATLPKIKASSQDYLDLFIHTLKKLQAQDLDRLETLSSPYLKPRFFEELFELSKIYQKKEQDYADKAPEYKYHFLAVELLQQGHTERSFKVGASTEVNPNYTFLTITTLLANRGQLFKALEAANKISDKKIQTFALEKIIASSFHPKNLFNIEAWEIVRLYW